VGLEKAKGDYFAFIDSDDAWHPLKLELQLSALNLHNLSFLSTEHYSFTSTRPELTQLDLNKPRIEALSIKPITHQSLIRKNRVVTSSALMSSVIAKKLCFDEREVYTGIEDYLAWLGLHQDESMKSAVLRFPLVFYRIRNDSISSSKLTMAKKIFYLLKHYRLGGKTLGLKRFLYFGTYIAHSLADRIFRPTRER